MIIDPRIYGTILVLGLLLWVAAITYIETRLFYWLLGTAQATMTLTAAAYAIDWLWS